MRQLALSLAILFLAAGPSLAIDRYESTKITCQKARELVATKGAVIFRYPSARKPGLTLYNRYVRNGGYCAVGETAASQAIPVAAGETCRLLRCIGRPDDDGFLLRRPGGGNLGNLGGPP